MRLYEITCTNRNQENEPTKQSPPGHMIIQHGELADFAAPELQSKNRKKKKKKKSPEEE